MAMNRSIQIILFTAAALFGTPALADTMAADYLRARELASESGIGATSVVKAGDKGRPRRAMTKTKERYPRKVKRTSQ